MEMYPCQSDYKELISRLCPDIWKCTVLSLYLFYSLVSAFFPPFCFFFFCENERTEGFRRLERKSKKEGSWRESQVRDVIKEGALGEGERKKVDGGVNKCH